MQLSASSKYSLRRVGIDTLVLVSLALLIIPFSLQRIVAGDEGFYLYAAKLVMRGQIPYRDFFYPQALYLPYFYGAWMKFMGLSWESARLLSAFFCIGIGFVLFRFVSSGLKLGPAFGFSALVLFVASGWTLPWLCIAKAYSGGLFFLFLSYYLVAVRTDTTHPSRLFFAGLCFSIAVGFRLYMAVLFPVLLACVLFSHGMKRRHLKETCWFLGGCFIGALPLILSMLSDFDRFYYNNVSYHVERSSTTFARSVNEKWRLLLKLFGFAPTEELLSAHFPILFALACLEVPLALYKRRIPHSAFFAVLLLSAASIVPSPAYFQYFCLVYPFLLVCLFHLLAEAIPYLRSKLHAQPKFYAPALFLIVTGFTFLYLRSAPAEFSRYTKTGFGLAGVTTWDHPRTWQLKTVTQAVTLIDKLVQPNETVLAMWPGHLFATKADVLPGSENQFSARASTRLSMEQQERYHLMSAPTMRKLLEQGKVKLFVKIKSQMLLVRVKDEELAQWGYRQVAKIEGIKFFVKG